MDTPMLDYVLTKLDASKGRLPSIAADTGISYRTLQKIALRVVTNPGVSHVQRLHDYFRVVDSTGNGSPLSTGRTPPSAA